MSWPPGPRNGGMATPSVVAGRSLVKRAVVAGSAKWGKIVGEKSPLLSSTPAENSRRLFSPAAQPKKLVRPSAGIGRCELQGRLDKRIARVQTGPWQCPPFLRDWQCHGWLGDAAGGFSIKGLPCSPLVTAVGWFCVGKSAIEVAGPNLNMPIPPACPGTTGVADASGRLAFSVPSVEHGRSALGRAGRRRESRWPGRPGHGRPQQQDAVAVLQ